MSDWQGFQTADCAGGWTWGIEMTERTVRDALSATRAAAGEGSLEPGRCCALLWSVPAADCKVLMKTKNTAQKLEHSKSLQ